MDKNNKILKGCYFAFFVNGMASLMLGAILPSLLIDFNIGYDKGGMLLAFQSTGNLIASFLGGIIASQLGRKNSIVLLSTIGVLGFAGMIFTQSPTILLILFFMAGISRGGVSNFNNTLVNEISDGAPGPLNILHTFFAVGAFMAPFIASWFVKIGLDWKYSIGLITILSTIMVLIFISMNIIDVEKQGKNTKENKSYDFLKNLDFYISSGILFFYVGVEFAVNGWIVTYLIDAGLMNTSLAQKILSLLWVVIIFGRLFSAYISQTMNKKTIILASSTGVMLFFALFLLSSSTWAIVITILGLGFCLAGIFPTTVSNAGEIVKDSDLAMGTLLALGGLGGIIMPYITGVVAESKGIVGGMITVILGILFMFLFSLINRFRKN
ncbi:MAG: MFS transporter [Tissierellia bacterium]|nr:MFS transporter [Tissierellia bacterium]